MKSHYHFLFWFYTEKHAGDFTEVTAVDVIAKNLETAIKEAQKFDNRSYFLKQVIEHHDSHEGMVS